MDKLQVLLVDDCGELPETLFKNSFDAPQFLTVQKGTLAASLRRSPPDLVLMALDGLGHIPRLFECIDIVKDWDDELPILVFSRAGGVKESVAVMRRRVTHYFREPWDKEDVKRVAEGAIRLYHLTKKIFVTERLSPNEVSFEGMIGVSREMRENFHVISVVAKSNATVLILGESGTGKELVAKAIHRRSERARHRFVDLNCGAIPKDLLENELFGHERGAFTGAERRYEGSFEVADGGTLFLDEISEMDPLLQVKLLRVLQERSFNRIGGRDKIAVNVRIIAATNRQLETEIKRGAFREDLYYRLNVIPIHLPSLRDRREDIPLLAKYFLDRFCAKNNRIFLDFTQEALEAMVNYDWPGNVRELENTIERIVVLNDDSTVKLKHLPPALQKVERKISWDALSRQDKEASTTLLSLEEMEKQTIENALKLCQGNIALVSKKLEVSPATLYRKIKKFELAF